ncbi:PmbA-related protein [Thermosipho melanesiensis]|uniref:Peptidase U62, modulator of DNA gyrase n=2 Tax=Thermosipho melanesiensis TaxID=46541 RepID=A6LJ35_THEM4|nr:TldD/PmbA family protein [Thermosipho melanesiensis]ABR29936.1 peptidase U62, modulator of DNA gyrase [Thermosipho melanesiensis BI429]APT73144.1 PmbA-related protein [Thermosipho melanesiensis]OOC38540.1 PmbA-related protein [Thermosipho melanesiensis]OOC40344.1 PmbA-related protein [Thermosipho melanesiensis]OOC40608.1 PmbA-related protein [Thermosipho melanesiensis]
MNINEFKEKLFSIAKANGFEAQVEITEKSEFMLSYANNDIDQYKDASNSTITLKILKDGKIGKSISEKFDNPEELFTEAFSNWKITDSEDENFFYDGKDTYIEMDTYDGSFENTSVKEKIKFIKKLHDSAKCDERIVMVPNAVFQNIKISKTLSNTLGLDISSKMDGGYSYTIAISKDESTHSGFWFEVGKKFEDLDPEEIGKKACKEALSLLGAKSVKSGKYRVILRNTAFEDMLGLLKSMISAENVQKNMSPLKGKINEKIGSNILTIKDLPYVKGSINNRPFDDEGVPTKETTIFENGIFKNYLYDLKTAKKDNVKSTGNSINGSISPINLVIEKGDYSYEELIKKLKSGIIIVGVDGMHSGSNPVSGDFSLGARGYKVENGNIVGAVEQITISGNFVELLSKIEAIGNDWKHFGDTLTPSVLISELDIAGE